MADYKEIKGSLVQSVSSDPEDATSGQIFYNTTTTNFKLSRGAAVKSFSTGPNMNAGRYDVAGGGSITDAWACGGQSPVIPSTTKTNFETYNGTAWTAPPGQSLNGGTDSAAVVGDNSAALLLIGGGYPVSPNTKCQYFSGQSWNTGVNPLNTGREKLAATGNIQNALAFGGDTPPSTAATESWDGVSWTTVNSLNSAGYYVGGAGTNTDALAFGGQPRTTATESWNGTNWTTLNNLVDARPQANGFGSSTDAICFRGQAPSGIAEWNGTCWSLAPYNLNTNRVRLASSSQQNTGTGLAFSGFSDKTNTEELSSVGGLVNIGATSDN